MVGPAGDDGLSRSETVGYPYVREMMSRRGKDGPPARVDKNEFQFVATCITYASITRLVISRASVDWREMPFD